MEVAEIGSFVVEFTVGSGGRITIPQEMRDDLELVDGDTLTTRLESSETGQKQLTIWKQKEG